MQTIDISLQSLNIASISVPGIIVIFAISLIFLSMFAKNLSKAFYVSICILAILIDIVILTSFELNQKGFFGVIYIDGITVLSQLIILISSLIFITFHLCKEKFKDHEIKEYFGLFLFVVAGFSFMVSTNNIILILVGLETSSLALYTLVALRNKTNSIEAAIKYFSMGALSTGFYVMGASLLYLLTGYLEIDKIVKFILDQNLQHSILLLGASAFLFVSMAFKLSLIPFHTWIVDVYEASSSPLAGYISIVPKIVAFVIMIRFFEPLNYIEFINSTLWLVAVLSMSLGNVMALVQKDVKRMLAYSSVSHCGFVLCAILVGTNEANVGLFVYWIMFLLANLGAFGMLFVTSSSSKTYHYRFDHPYEKFKGAIKTRPIFAILMTIFMLTLAGIPPFSVFWGKIYLISVVVHEERFYLAFIMAVNSAIAIYYYLKLIVVMFMQDVSKDSLCLKNLSNSLKVILGTLILCVILSSVLINPLSECIKSLLISSGF